MSARLVFCAGVVLCAQAAAARQSLQDVVQLTGERRLAEAHALADTLTAPLEREQARLYVKNAGGDLAGALGAGLAGLAAAPQDLWMLERSTALALSLSSSDLASELVTRFGNALSGQGEDARATYAATHENYAAAAAALSESSAQRDRSLLLARVVVLAGAAVTIGVLLRHTAART